MYSEGLRTTNTLTTPDLRRYLNQGPPKHEIVQRFLQRKDELKFILHMFLNTILPTPDLGGKFLSALLKEKRVYKMA
jgi:hypothetical protein